ncbi:hypothetical protein BGW39_003397 [Mortierella sp. 14UC]|nr:hypothetical protein BGW39_003397 [Mortierella sp. 14UC]
MDNTLGNKITGAAAPPRNVYDQPSKNSRPIFCTKQVVLEALGEFGQGAMQDQDVCFCTQKAMATASPF